MSVTIPTELNLELQQNNEAKSMYHKLSQTAKRSYAAYILAAKDVNDRKCRAKHSLKMLLGQAQMMNARC